MINKIVLFIHDYWFKFFYINKSQTLRHQLMIIFMHIHYLKRLDVLDEFTYIGEDNFEVNADKYDIDKLYKRIIFFISPQYKKKIEESSKKLNEEQKLKESPETSEVINALGLVFVILNNSQNNEKEPENEFKDFYEIKEDGEKLIFSIKNSGFSYQYNGYKKSEIKLQSKANLFALLTIFGATFVWIDSKELIGQIPQGYWGLIAIDSVLLIVCLFRRKFTLPLESGTLICLVIIACTLGIWFWSGYKETLVVENKYYIEITI